jgi:hypothetical protein
MHLGTGRQTGQQQLVVGNVGLDEDDHRGRQRRRGVGRGGKKASGWFMAWT